MAMTAQSASSSSILGASRAVNSAQAILSSAQFREIHKNTWLKRLTAEGKKITVGPKKSERSWVVFCVHDDTEAILEGYAEPRQAVSHNPEWFVSMQSAQHISHALIPNSNEFEFVITLSNEVIRFHAMSWEIMQEWVDTLRSKLREMKILSPRENLYTKLPEARLPLLPTRDPTSPLPAPPPVPAAIVPGVEPVVVPQSMLQTTTTTTSSSSDSMARSTATTSITTMTTSTAANNSIANTTISTTSTTQTTPSHIPAMSNTLTQNLLNMLSDPISAYSEQLQAVESSNTLHNIANRLVNEQLSTSLNNLQLDTRSENETGDCLSPLLRPENSESFSANNVSALKSKRHSADNARNIDNVIQCERLIPRPQTSRSQSAGAADKSRNSRQLAGPSSSSGATTVSTESTIKETSRKSSEKNITALEITTNTISNPIRPRTSNTAKTDPSGCEDDECTHSNITIIQVSTDNGSEQVPKLPFKTIPKTNAAEVFKFPETNEDEITKPSTSAATTKTKHPEYRSNVQLIPSKSSANSSTIKVLGDVTTSSSNQYLKPLKNSPSKQLQKTSTSTSTSTTTTSSIQTESNKVTTVHVSGETGSTTSVSIYGTCFTPSIEEDASSQSTPKLPKKIILSANTSGITNITVDSNAPAVHSKLKIKNKNIENTPDVSVRCNIGNVHYEKVFLSSSTPITSVNSTTSIAASTATITNSTTTTTTVNTYVSSPTAKILKKSNDCVSPVRHKHISTSTESTNNSTSPSTSAPSALSKRVNKSVQTTSAAAAAAAAATSAIDILPPRLPQRIGGSPALQRRAIALRPPNMLTRGQTEAVITTRPSRRDFYFNNGVRASKNQNSSHHINNKSTNKSQIVPANNNENGDATLLTEATTTALNTAANRTISDVIEQRRRSSSTSDARIQQQQQQRTTSRGANNNEFAAAGNRNPNSVRIQQPPQPFRSVENSLTGAAAGMSSPPPTGSSGTKRMTLREQQVMQLRREIIHPGGVRLQLRRKDCVGSIAWVEAFGAVWVAGWKQKEHPVLYNALHIGDQLLSIAGIAITSGTEANKIIRNANTLFVEVLIRRMPFARPFAIRREREGQCLGLIRDGNTATIVDVVPNSLAARHGLPPKAQSCDGASLTFWMLTEINSRPLNLFFKDNEIRDRLNSVGRDISILVQPSDLITKLKKQLKSLRGYKDYLVQ